MKIAYMMLAHKNFEQIELLITALKDPDIDIYIHVDKKSEDLFLKLKAAFKSNPNIFILEQRVDIKWGGLSMVDATLKLMNKVSCKEYNYISLISGQDYPIKSLQRLKDFLIENEGKEFIDSEPIGKAFWRLKCYNLFSENPNSRKKSLKIIEKLIRLLQIVFVRRNNLKGLELVKGSQWFTITKECHKYILDYLCDNLNYYEDFKYTHCPDESFFHIIILNSHFSENVVNNDLTYIDWENAIAGSPRTLTIRDLEKISSSGDFFARKFDLDLDREILLKLQLK
jgi:hypothetical protein